MEFANSNPNADGSVAHSTVPGSLYLYLILILTVYVKKE